MQIGKLELSDREVKTLSDEAIATRLVESGVTRLTAEKLVAIARGKNEPGRARPHVRGWR